MGAPVSGCGPEGAGGQASAAAPLSAPSARRADARSGTRSQPGPALRECGRGCPEEGPHARAHSPGVHGLNTHLLRDAEVIVLEDLWAKALARRMRRAGISPLGARCRPRHIRPADRLFRVPSAARTGAASTRRCALRNTGCVRAAGLTLTAMRTRRSTSVTRVCVGWQTRRRLPTRGARGKPLAAFVADSAQRLESHVRAVHCVAEPPGWATVRAAQRHPTMNREPVPRPARAEARQTPSGTA